MNDVNFSSGWFVGRICLVSRFIGVLMVARNHPQSPHCAMPGVVPPRGPLCGYPLYAGGAGGYATVDSAHGFAQKQYALKNLPSHSPP